MKLSSAKRATTAYPKVVTIHGFKDFKEMDRRERIRACYQHCALKWVTSQRMTNSSLRERFGLYKNKSAVVSQIIATTVDASLIKLDEQGSVSRRFARYIVLVRKPHKRLIYLNNYPFFCGEDFANIVQSEGKTP